MLTPFPPCVTMATDFFLGTRRLDGQSSNSSLIYFLTNSIQFFVLCFASIMKFRNWRNTLKLERQTATEHAERGEMVQTLPVDEDIPFGVCALQQEPAVEGVWNAGLATSLRTPSRSRGSSIRHDPSRLWQKKRGSSVSWISRLNIEESAQPASVPSC